MAKAAEKTAEQIPEVIEFVKAKAITMSRFHNLVDRLNHWYVEAEMGTTVEQVMDESYFANISMHLRAGATITVMPDDMAWKLELHVSGSGNKWAHVVKLNYYDLTPATPPVKLPSIYKVEYAGSHHKFRVLREGNMLKDGFETESLAARWAKNHEDAVNR